MPVSQTYEPGTFTPASPLEGLQIESLAAASAGWTATHQSADLAHARVGSLIDGHALDAALLDTELTREPLELGIRAVAGRELGLVDGALVTEIPRRHIGIRGVRPSGLDIPLLLAAEDGHG